MRSIPLFSGKTMDELITLTGTVEDITYQNPENGYTILDFSCDGELFTATGNIGDVYIGEKLTFHGSWVVHPSYGKQLKIEICERSIPETAGEMLLYLSSGIIKGVKEKTAQKIVREFGDETFEIIENHPDRLARINGISLSKAKEISNSFIKLSGERNAVIALEKYGMTTNEALKVYDIYGSNSASIVERNPYLLSTLEIGINFERAEKIAAALPSPPDEKFRIQEGIIFVMKHNLSNGHTCVPRESLLPPCKDLLDCLDDDIEIAIDTLIEQKRLISDSLHCRDFIFLPDYYEAELNSANALRFIKHYAAPLYTDINEEIKKTEVVGGVVYSDRQRLAIKYALEKGILILTGGPGTGKTTTLRGILKAYENCGLEVSLAAPTGRAAKRMSELTGKEAVTIHRLLEVEWDSNDRQHFKRNQRNPLSCQAVIVDELSMVDSKLFASLLDALPLGCRLVMVGDSDQLPPVGPGNVLHDMIDSKVIPVIELNEIFRQAMESLIIYNAHKIVSGEMPELNVKNKDFFFMERKSPVSASETVCELCSKRLPDAYNLNPLADIQVLCPSRKGESGTVNLNKLLQSRLNPFSPKKKEFKSGSRIFREGDKLMQTKNNYDIEWESGDKTGTGVFNGDIGILEKIDMANQLLTVNFDDKIAKLPFESCTELEHAYAVTVHKSQGNEFPAVIIPVIGVNSLLCYRNLLYTAVTRAKDLIILTGSEETVRSMVENNKKQKRYSALKSFLVLGEKN